MKRNYYQNQLERFRTIAKKLVDQHSAELNKVCGFEVEPQTVDDIYQDHFNNLGRELDTEAKSFLETYNIKQDSIVGEIWNTCNKYLQHFAQRNQPVV